MYNVYTKIIRIVPYLGRFPPDDILPDWKDCRSGAERRSLKSDICRFLMSSGSLSLLRLDRLNSLSAASVSSRRKASNSISLGRSAIVFSVLYSENALSGIPAGLRSCTNIEKTISVWWAFGSRFSRSKANGTWWIEFLSDMVLVVCSRGCKGKSCIGRWD